MTAAFALIMAAFAIIQLWLLSRAVDALESRHDARLKALEHGRKQEPTKVYVPTKAPEPAKQELTPQTGTVAAKAVKPRVFLSQVPHTAVELDNGGLEWESKF